MINTNTIKYLPTINNIVQYGIEEAEQLNKKNKINKKDTALEIIKNTIEILDDNDYKIFLMACYENGTINETIDLVINASKGKLNVNKKINVLLNCLTSVINIIKKKLK